ncbi:TVP38/TMEM64 family protein [Nocardia stercoris]
MALLAVGVVLLAAALLLPHPAPGQIRDWGHSVGPLLPVVFVLVHALVTVAPFPRTLFTLSAGLLFGPLPGVCLAIAATSLSAVLALLLVRALGREAVSGWLTHPAVRSVDRRLAERGWLAVGSLRMIGPVPFSVVNYCAGLSRIRLLPYIIATAVGSLPGTIGTVLLGNALTGRTSPTMLAVTGACMAVGLAGLLLDLRWGRDRFRDPQPETVTV